MPKVSLQISYEINPDKRDEYLSLTKELRNHFVAERKKSYRIYETKGRKNSFVEEFLCSSMEEYEALEDDMDENSEKLVNQLEALLKGGKAKYTTLVEVE
jgi:hypothetical protein